MSRIANAGAVGLGTCFGLAVSALVGLTRLPAVFPPSLPPAFPSSAPPVSGVRLRVEVDRNVATVDDRFLSFAVDTAQVVGGEFWAPRDSAKGLLRTHVVPRYDFSRQRLRRLAGQLAPAYLRIGGTDADRTVYRLGDDRTQSGSGTGTAPAPAPVPKGARWVLTGARWDEVNAFAHELDLQIVFTVNAGPSARDASGAWDPENARGLIEYSQQRRYPVAVWELGNEVNAFPLTHGSWLSAARYAGDLRRARSLLDELRAPGLLAGGGSAFWPVLGEGRAITDGTLRAAGDVLDIVTWHYYPQQSHRCPLATRRAELGRTPSPARLSEIDHWAHDVEASARKHAPHAAVWLGETGSAQCGGEPGVSNTYADALWWLDQMGRIARRGQQVVVRQTLSGSDYGLIDDETLQPNPSYWASWLWRHLMGTRVLAIAAEPQATFLRTYAHCLRSEGRGAQPEGGGEGGGGGVVVLLINLHPTQPIVVDLAATVEVEGPAHVLRFDAVGLASRQARLDGDILKAQADGTPPSMLTAGLDSSNGGGKGGHHSGTRENRDTLETEMMPRLSTLSLPPLTTAFVSFPEARAAACR